MLLLLVLVSQPFVGLASQLPKPALHANPHVPLVHVRLALVGVGHATLHPPQFITSFAVDLSHPSAALLLQSPKPALQVMPHMLEPHRGIALAPPRQARPHIPQFAASDVTSTHEPPQATRPPVQAATHPPALQNCAPGQVLPHSPQLAGEVCRLVSHPLAGLPSQFPNPVLQVKSAHMLAEHDAMPFANEHVRPHMPQFVTLVRVFTSHPFIAFMSQSAKPGSHVSWHMPDMHAVVEFAPA